MKKTKVLFRDKLFFVVQGFLKYNAFNFGIKLRSFFYRPFLKHMGKNVRIFDGVTVKFPSEIILEDNVTINQMCFLAGLGGLTIKKNCMVGNNSIIVTTTHEIEQIDIPMANQGLSYKQIIIEEDVWLGAGSKIFYGSVINKGSVVGAGCVIINKTFPEYAVIVGVPGQIIKTRI